MRGASQAAKLGAANENAASRIAMLAEKKCGQFIREMKEDGTLKHGGHNKKDEQGNTAFPCSLDDEGITKDQSSHYQKMADIDEEVIAEYVEECDAEGKLASREAAPSFFDATQAKAARR